MLPASPRAQKLIRATAELRHVAASSDGRKRLAKRAASLLTGYWKDKLVLLWQTARSNHTIVNAVAPPEEDILGSTLQDEQVRRDKLPRR